MRTELRDISDARSAFYLVGMGESSTDHVGMWSSIGATMDMTGHERQVQLPRVQKSTSQIVKMHGKSHEEFGSTKVSKPRSKKKRKRKKKGKTRKMKTYISTTKHIKINTQYQPTNHSLDWYSKLLSPSNATKLPTQRHPARSASAYRIFLNSFWPSQQKFTPSRVTDRSIICKRPYCIPFCSSVSSKEPENM